MSLESAKRERLLAAATQIFTRLGFKKASIDEIAKAAGVGKGSVYLAWSSKEDLFYEVVRRQVAAWVAMAKERIDPERPADELLAELALSSLEYLEQHPLVRDFFRGLYHAELPGWESRFEDFRRMVRSLGIEVLQLGIAQGRFRADLDVEAVADVLQDVQFLFFVANAEQMRERMARHAGAGLDLALRGLLAR